MLGVGYHEDQICKAHQGNFPLHHRLSMAIAQLTAHNERASMQRDSGDASSDRRMRIVSGAVSRVY